MKKAMTGGARAAVAYAALLLLLVSSSCDALGIKTQAMEREEREKELADRAARNQAEGKAADKKLGCYQNCIACDLKCNGNDSCSAGCFRTSQNCCHAVGEVPVMSGCGCRD